jgi:hypothetical protein
LMTGVTFHGDAFFVTADTTRENDGLVQMS